MRLSWLAAALLVACGPAIPPPAPPAPALPTYVAPEPATPHAAASGAGGAGTGSAPVRRTAAQPAPGGSPGPALAKLLGDEFPGPTLAVHFIDVGQGDAILVRTPDDKHVLIDTGPDPDATRLLAHLHDIAVTELDLVINTHPHADHIGGLVALLDRVPVKMILDSGFVHPTKQYEKMLEAIEKKKVPVRVARRGRKIKLGDEAVLTVLAPEDPLIRGSRSDANANSVVVRLDYRKISFLFTGDAEEETEQRLLRGTAEDIDVTVLKVAHHGSRYASHSDFLSAVSPALAVISASADNKYGHPDPATLQRLRALGVDYLSTSEVGHVVIATDGQKLRVTVQPRGSDNPVPATFGSIRFAAAPAAPDEPRSPPPVASAEGAVDLNKASEADLVRLPGIGKKTAERIIEHRQANGPFKSVDDLGHVKGVGKKTLDKIRPMLTLGASAAAPSAPASPAAPVAAPAPRAAEPAPPSAGGMVDLNKASEADLVRLPGIGKKTAERILEYRQTNGPFKTVDDLGRVKGIGDKTLEKLRPLITVSAGS